MEHAKVDGKLIHAAPDSPETAVCPACDGIVKKRKRRTGDGKATYFYRHKAGVGDGCPYRYRPVD